MYANPLTDLCKGYIAIYDRIYDLKTGEAQELAEGLINFCTERKWDIAAVLLIISNAAECNLLYLREYWELFKKLFNHFKIRPPIPYMKPHIAVLFSKEYQIKLNNIQIPEHLNNYNEMELDDIFNIYKPLSSMHCILHDDITEFCIAMGPLIKEETIKEKIEDKTLLEWCCYYGALKCFRYLMMNNAEITNNCFGYSLIGKNKDLISELLVEFGDTIKEFDVMKIALQINDEDYLVSLRNDYKQSWSLENAAQALNLKAFLMLASVTSKTDLAFIYWSRFGITEMIETLCYQIEYSNEYDANFAVSFSAAYNNIESISKLIKIGAKVNFKDNNNMTPLIAAASNNCVDAISKLVELNADLEAQDKNGATALIAAAFFNSVESIEKLKELGANIEAIDNSGGTAITVAARNNCADAIAKLAELGANIEALNYYGEPPLTIAVKYNSVDSLAKLVELGANIETKDFDGLTPLIYAAFKNYAESIPKLIELGANIEAKDNSGYTALYIAIEMRNVESVVKLIDAGAKIDKTDRVGARVFSTLQKLDLSQSI